MQRHISLVLDQMPSLLRECRLSSPAIGLHAGLCRLEETDVKGAQREILEIGMIRRLQKHVMT